MPFLALKNNKLCTYYELHGNRKKQTLVLISGLKGDHNVWSPLLTKLQKNYQVLIFDNRGCGKTTDNSVPFTVETLADDTMSILENLNLDQPIVIGHSLGGAITQVTASKYSQKIKKVVLCNTFAKFNDDATQGFTRILRLHQKAVTPEAIMMAIAPLVFSSNFLTVDFLKILSTASREQIYPQTLGNYTRQWQALTKFDGTKWLKTITIPTLVIGSSNDIICTVKEAEELHQKIKNSQLIILPGAHVSIMEQPLLLLKNLKNYCAT